MPPADSFLTFLAATLLFAYIPGPALLYAAAQTVAGGRRAGLTAAVGLHLGGYVHVLAAATGLSALFHTVPTLYVVVKLIGAIYLVWLGVCMLKNVLSTPVKAPIKGAPFAKTRRQVLSESITVEVLNPKTALFFIAFLPQFVDPQASFPIWLQFLILGSVANLLLASADLVCVFFAGIIVDRLRQSTRAAQLLEGLGGSLLIALGLHLFLQRN